MDNRPLTAACFFLFLFISANVSYAQAVVNDSAPLEPTPDGGLLETIIEAGVDFLNDLLGGGEEPPMEIPPFDEGKQGVNISSGGNTGGVNYSRLDGLIKFDELKTCTIQYVVPETDTKTAMSSTRTIQGWQDATAQKTFVKTTLRHDAQGKPYFDEAAEPYNISVKVPANITQRLATMEAPCLVETTTKGTTNTTIVKTYSPDYEYVGIKEVAK